MFSRWDRIGDIVILPATSFKNSLWDSIAEELWLIVAKSLKAHRLARQVIIYTYMHDKTNLLLCFPCHSFIILIYFFPSMHK